MSYQNGYVVCALVNGQVADEHNKTVYLLEGEEYGLRLRNKNDVDAVAKIFIDGENVSEGGYLVRAHKHVDILRHSYVDKAFKLISHTRKQAQEEGKDELRSTSGTVEVQWFKKYVDKPYQFHDNVWPQYWKSPSPYNRPDGVLFYNTEISSRGLFSCSTADVKHEPEHLTSQPGVTVEGGKTGQEFQSVHIDLESNYTSVYLYLKLLRGAKANSIFYDYCSNCGKKIGRSANYCSICGRPIGVE